VIDTAGAGQSPGVVTLGLGDINRIRVSVSTATYPSLFCMLTDSVAGITRGLPATWRERIGRTVTQPGHRAIAPLGAAQTAGWVPDCLLPAKLLAGLDTDSALDTLRTADPADVQANLLQEFGDHATSVWRPAIDRPKQWMADASVAMDAVAALSRPLFTQARPLFDREIERVGVATVRKMTTALLSTLNSRVTLRNGALTFNHPIGGHYELAGRELILVPMVTGDRMLMADFDQADHVWLGYPLPGLGTLWNTPTQLPRPPEAALEALLGATRAAALAYLDTPTTMTELATATGVHAARMTHHCDRLHSAGLVERHRHGRTVRVSRSELGSQLLEIYR